VTSIVCFGGSLIFGTVLGWLFAVIWRWFAPASMNRRFWASLGNTAKELLAVDEPRHLLELYGRLWVDLGGYLMRNVGGLVLGCLPVGLFLALVAPAALGVWDRTADGVALYPDVAATGRTRAAPSEVLAGLGIPGAGLAEMSSDAPRRTAICWTATSCTVFQLLAFRVMETPKPVLPEAPYLVVRPWHHDINPLWPYLSDLEFVFAGALMAGSVVGLMRGRAIRRG
jgi:hypothetical protein